MNYFGTNLTSAGHYFWEVKPEHLLKAEPEVFFNTVPFNPEELTDSYARNGLVKYLRVGDYAICAIAGSCSDSRPGSKSVFWLQADIAPETLKDMILAIPIAKKMIEQMPFEVQW